MQKQHFSDFLRGTHGFSRSKSAAGPNPTFPLRLKRRRILILPTRHGLLFMAVLGAMLLGSLNEHNNLGFMMTFLLSGILFVSLFHTYRNLSDLEILSAGAVPVFSGETAVFDLRIHAGRWPRSAVAFALTREKTVLTDLPAGRDAWVKLKVPAVRRGMMAPGDLQIQTRFPLGLFRAWSRVPLPAACLVYPRPVVGFMEMTSAEMTADDRRINGGGKSGVEDFQGLRAYQPGDPPQHIAWKAFSRGQGLLTKSFAGPGRDSLMLDDHRVRESDPERRLSILCHHVLQAEMQRTAYGLRLQGTRISPGLGPAHRHRCLRALALAGTG